MQDFKAISSDVAVWARDKLPLVLEWLQAHPNAAALPAPLSAAAATVADALAGLQDQKPGTSEGQKENKAANVSSASLPGCPIAAMRAVAASLLPSPQARDAFISAAEKHAWYQPWPKTSLMSAQRTEEPQGALAAAVATDLPSHSHLSAYDSPLKDVVVSEELRGALAIVVPWFNACRPFVIVGPAGSGKRTLLDAAVAAMPGVQRADVACNSHTKAEHIIQKLVQVTSAHKPLRQRCNVHHGARTCSAVWKFVA